MSFRWIFWVLPELIRSTGPRLHKEVEYQKYRGIYQNQNAIELQMHRAANAILQYIERIIETFTDHPKQFLKKSFLELKLMVKYPE